MFLHFFTKNTNQLSIATELHGLLIFLYCIAWNLHSGYPAFLSVKTSLRFFKRTIIILRESDSRVCNLSASNLKTIYYVIHLIAYFA